ncbi:hypothetical protein HOY80DRAFT_156403 [Tuber brumale]|nr:hypothetical protein HOY80DRAFT_156403 [Tuber brumale]
MFHAQWGELPYVLVLLCPHAALHSRGGLGPGLEVNMVVRNDALSSWIGDAHLASYFRRSHGLPVRILAGMPAHRYSSTVPSVTGCTEGWVLYCTHWTLVLGDEGKRGEPTLVGSWGGSVGRGVWYRCSGGVTLGMIAKVRPTFLPTLKKKK